MGIETDLMPQRINHLPVVAAVALAKVRGTHVEKRWVVVCHDARDDTYVTWEVFAQRHAVTGGYLAQTGHYDLSYARAVSDMLRRADFAVTV